MKIFLIILLLLINSQKLFASSQICGWIMDEPFQEYKEEAEDAIKLRSKCDQGFEYDGGMWATAYLASLSGSNQKVFFDFYEDIAELELEKRKEGKIHQGWRESFRKNFNMSYDDFLIEFESFIDLKSKEQLKILDQIN